MECGSTRLDKLLRVAIVLATTGGRAAETFNLLPLSRVTWSCEELVQAILRAPYVRYGQLRVSASAALGHLHRLEWLLLCGANINITFNAATPLMHACQSGQIDSVRMLLRHGATCSNDLFDAPLLAVKHGNLELLNIFIGEVDLNLPYLLREAVKQGFVPIVQGLLLCISGVDSSMRDHESATPRTNPSTFDLIDLAMSQFCRLESASSNKSLQPDFIGTVSLLVDAPAALTAQQAGAIVVWAAAQSPGQRARVLVAGLLARHVIAPESILRAAMRAASADVLEALLSTDVGAGFDLNALAPGVGSPPLFQAACSQGAPEEVLLLLMSRGAKPNAASFLSACNRSDLPISVPLAMIRGGFNPLIPQLVGANTRAPIDVVFSTGGDSLKQVLLQEVIAVQTDLLALDPALSMRMLGLACTLPTSDLAVQLLLEHGAAPTASAFEAACYSGLTRTIVVMCGAGGDEVGVRGRKLFDASTFDLTRLVIPKSQSSTGGHQLTRLRPANSLALSQSSLSSHLRNETNNAVASLESALVCVFDVLRVTPTLRHFEWACRHGFSSVMRAMLRRGLEMQAYINTPMIDAHTEHAKAASSQQIDDLRAAANEAAAAAGQPRYFDVARARAAAVVAADVADVADAAAAAAFDGEGADLVGVAGGAGIVGAVANAANAVAAAMAARGLAHAADVAYHNAIEHATSGGALNGDLEQTRFVDPEVFLTHEGATDTLLSFACRWGDTGESIRILFEIGAVPSLIDIAALVVRGLSIRDEGALLLLSVALSCGPHIDVAASSVDFTLFSAAEYGMRSHRLAEGTLLELACAASNSRCALALLDAGAHPSVSAARLCCRNNLPSVLDSLLSHPQMPTSMDTERSVIGTNCSQMRLAIDCFSTPSVLCLLCHGVVPSPADVEAACDKECPEILGALLAPRLGRTAAYATGTGINPSSLLLRVCEATGRRVRNFADTSVDHFHVIGVLLEFGAAPEVACILAFCAAAMPRPHLLSTLLAARAATGLTLRGHAAVSQLLETVCVNAVDSKRPPDSSVTLSATSASAEWVKIATQLVDAGTTVTTQALLHVCNTHWRYRNAALLEAMLHGYALSLDVHGPTDMPLPPLPGELARGLTVASRILALRCEASRTALTRAAHGGHTETHRMLAALGAL